MRAGKVIVSLFLIFYYFLLFLFFIYLLIFLGGGIYLFIKEIND